MFFRKKRYSEVEGYDRISRMIDDREGEGANTEPFDEEVTVLLSREARENAPAARGGADSTSRLPTGDVDPDESVESVLLVRPTVTPVAPPVSAAQSAWAGSASVTPVDAPSAPVAVPAFQPPPLPEPPRMPAPDLSFAGAGADTASLVAKDAVWEGKLVCSGNVRIEGTLRGEIETTGTLFVAAEARVDGTVRARTVTLAGEIKGELHCEDRLEILPGGAARGEVDTGALVVHEGAFIESRFQMRREEVAAR